MFILAAPATQSQEIKRSRFLAVAAPVSDEEAARAFLAAQSVPDANHNCWAWRIGQTYRFSDDGEPSGTAGKPILQAIDGQELDQVVVLVTRWFGGTLLGSGGLMRAYGGTAALCLAAAEKRRFVLRQEFRTTLSFSDLALVKARLSGLHDVTVARETFTETGAVLDLLIPAADVDVILGLIRDLTSGRAEVTS
ncbi:IMPACT family protein [Rhizobium sp. SL86]|uniref:IMPACT family protein n=1 Tax=Rhizobium sp. SL86 TaxID=2995148 RepID=UPI00227388DA|nr:YigZ family protein [Rhizobium sp. SL86]MCY1665390.1 IMPACT family protein [Rhizobium sp. SL86]